MSYDIDLFRPKGTKDLLKQARAVKEGRPSAREDLLRRALVDDLLALHPALEVHNAEKGFSYGCWVGNYDVDCGVPNIDVGVDTGFLSASYSADARVVENAINRVIAVFERHGFVAYDPQQDKILSKNVAGIIRRFATTQAVVVEAATKPKKSQASSPASARRTRKSPAPHRGRR